MRHYVEGSNPVQDWRAKQAARAAHPNVDAEMFVRQLYPGLPGRDVPACVVYEPADREYLDNLYRAAGLVTEDVVSAPKPRRAKGSRLKGKREKR